MAAAIPYLIVAASAVSTAVSYQGQRDAADDARLAGNMEAAALDRKGVAEESAARIRLKKLLGSQRALYAKAGVDLSVGSPLTILTDTEIRGEEEIKKLRQGFFEAADVTRFSTAAQYRAGRTRATGTLLSGLSATAGSAYSASRRVS